MKNIAIVYTSNTGYTAEYAVILGEKTGLRVYSLEEAETVLSKDCEIVYLSWLMAGKIVEYKKAAERFCIAAVCGVGLSAAGQNDMIRKNNSIPLDIPLFLLPGGYDGTKLKGMYKWIMKIVTKVMVRKINEKSELLDMDKVMLSVLKNGGSFVSAENLDGILQYMECR